MGRGTRIAHDPARVAVQPVCPVEQKKPIREAVALEDPRFPGEPELPDDGRRRVVRVIAILDGMLVVLEPPEMQEADPIQGDLCVRAPSGARASDGDRLPARLSGTGARAVTGPTEARSGRGGASQHRGTTGDCWLRQGETVVIRAQAPSAGLAAAADLRQGHALRRD
jgi:hypothetical protein